MLVVRRLRRGAAATPATLSWFAITTLRASSQGFEPPRNVRPLSTSSSGSPEVLDIDEAAEYALAESCGNCLRIAQLITPRFLAAIALEARGVRQEGNQHYLLLRSRIFAAIDEPSPAWRTGLRVDCAGNARAGALALGHDGVASWAGRLK